MVPKSAAAMSETPARVKLVVSFHPSSAEDALTWELKLYDASAIAGQPGSAVPPSTGLLISVMKTGGGSVGSNREFVSLVAALRSSGLLADMPDESLDKAVSSAPVGPKTSTANERGPSMYASDLLLVL